MSTPRGSAAVIERVEQLEDRLSRELKEIRKLVQTGARQSGDDLVTKSQAAKILDVSVRTFERHVAAGDIPAGAVLGRWLRWRRADVEHLRDQILQGAKPKSRRRR